ncbi:MAG: ferrous iron transport protein A [Caldilineales bacterium]|nr:ferrous iron transport protein A [Caldilineales bacterium]MDW8317159.1 FeoA family protein [Anaerolineae bacterium]
MTQVTRTKTLDQLLPGQSAQVRKVSGDGALRRRLMDMGLTAGTTVTVLKASPLGDPVEYRVRGYLLTLRKSEARLIEVSD